LNQTLRAFAFSLARNRERADDLVQDTVIRAWEKHASFTEGTNMRAWLFTILRNSFYSEIRKRRREVEDVDDAHAARLSVPASQLAHIELEEFKAALGEISAEQREALILIGVSGFSYEEAAEICGCAIGTVKSRVSRARTILAAKLAQPVAEEAALLAAQ
jgi:RNA polymerase sigma-70 factor (ECF subfamily)